MKHLTRTAIVLLVLSGAYLLGPRLKTEQIDDKLPHIYTETSSIEKIVKEQESRFNIRPDNEARIIWANDSLKNKTEYVILYLHGFSASWYEGYPVNINMGKAIGANIYLSRLHNHGIISDDPLIDMKPNLLYNSAKEALLIANTLGHKIIVASTSTGGTLSLMLARDFPELVDALVLLSPNISINNPASFLLNKPWGLQIARLSGSNKKYRILTPDSEMDEKYWYQKYRWEAVVYLQKLIEENLNIKLYNQIKQPVFLGYYYKNEEEQDPVVRVDAMLTMYDQLGTPDSLKRKVAFPDAANHVIACEAKSKSVDEVQTEVLDFVHFTVKYLNSK
jgi:pimeloyl-ACP methyl ester carboxylesterase